MSVIFAVVGLQQALNFAATQAYLNLHDVLSPFLPVAIGLELAGAVAIVLGYWTRLFVRDIAMAGGMLVLCARGSGDWSLDARRLAV